MSSMPIFVIDDLWLIAYGHVEYTVVENGSGDGTECDTSVIVCDTSIGVRDRSKVTLDSDTQQSLVLA